ncbi:MAG: DUF167 domain-containing protein [Syntrophales bacterium]|nr:DUF167 domain-containing protein [Syntrophales bacterium]
MVDIKETRSGVVIQVHVVPRAARTEFLDAQEGPLRIRVAAPPVEGKANREVIAFLSQLLKVAASRISIVGGARSRLKRIEVEGITPGEFVKRLSEATDG